MARQQQQQSQIYTFSYFWSFPFPIDAIWNGAVSIMFHIRNDFASLRKLWNKMILWAHSFIWQLNNCASLTIISNPYLNWINRLNFLEKTENWIQIDRLKGRNNSRKYSVGAVDDIYYVYYLRLYNDRGSLCVQYICIMYKYCALIYV